MERRGEHKPGGSLGSHRERHNQYDLSGDPRPARGVRPWYEQKVWENTYDGTCCERPEITPDGRTLVVGSDLKDFWYVIDAQSGI